MASDNAKKDICSRPQRNRRKVLYQYSSEDSSRSSVVDGKEESDESDETENILTEEEQNAIEKKFLLKNYNYKYLGHTADVILQGLGNSWEECFESICVGMFNYMCDLKNVKNKVKKKVEVTGRNINDLLFNFLTEFHFLYGSEYYICKHVHIVKFDVHNFQITAIGYGDTFDRFVHEGGTEVKGITKHGLNAKVENNKYEVSVLIDI